MGRPAIAGKIHEIEYTAQARSLDGGFGAVSGRAGNGELSAESRSRNGLDRFQAGFKGSNDAYRVIYLIPLTSRSTACVAIFPIRSAPG
jgi:hypothetical protein